MMLDIEDFSPQSFDEWIELKTGLNMWDTFPKWFGLPDEDPFWTGDDQYGTGE